MSSDRASAVIKAVCLVELVSEGNFLNSTFRFCGLSKLSEISATALNPRLRKLEADSIKS